MGDLCQKGYLFELCAVHFGYLFVVVSSEQIPVWEIGFCTFIECFFIRSGLTVRMGGVSVLLCGHVSAAFFVGSCVFENPVFLVSLFRLVGEVFGLGCFHF